ncbi:MULTISPECIES: TetR/AcrR family transcriptional regulator [Paenibacillus]|uniref:TetR/AcrR family transcriptional regulator n=1 Tax=Paenibacillus TaxID=44249 RepID=UPI000CF9F126|nr:MULTISPECIES: TetR/AcrR family transcriptional regulator [Paenibacillus]MBJ9987178.1 TetR family transcriptional regulator [Paenibacillus sp. S28]PQP89238.1 TetR family transcriptional regulator [Paenibacillus sp. AR247]
MKRHYDSEETRRIIAEKAAQLFSQKGFAGTSISDISKASGFSKGHVYYHFENKEKLFVYLALDGMRAWGEKWAGVSPNYKTARDKLYAMSTFVMNNYQTPLLKVGQELAANPATSPETVQQLYGLAVTPMQVYSDIFQYGIDTGEFEIDDLQGTTFLFGTLLGALCQHIYTMEHERLHGLFRKSVDLFLSGILKR